MNRTRLRHVFVVKQKTANEMRMSDWSSDVCSSDLLGTSSASQTYKVSQETSHGEYDADGSKKSEVEVKREMTDSGASADSGMSRGGTPKSIRSKDLPFRRYEGTLGGLFRPIQRSMGVTIWGNEGIYVSPVGRFSE